MHFFAHPRHDPDEDLIARPGRAPGRQPRRDRHASGAAAGRGQPRGHPRRRPARPVACVGDYGRAKSLRLAGLKAQPRCTQRNEVAPIGLGLHRPGRPMPQSQRMTDFVRNRNAGNMTGRQCKKEKASACECMRFCAFSQLSGPGRPLYERRSHGLATRNTCVDKPVSPCS
jgi:hypothetical protein